MYTEKLTQKKQLSITENCLYCQSCCCYVVAGTRFYCQ